VESLEGRVLMYATLYGDHLTIAGAQQTNQITLVRHVFKGGDVLELNDNGYVRRFNSASVGDVTIKGHFSDDVIHVGPGISNVRVYGGAGDDILCIIPSSNSFLETGSSSPVVTNTLPTAFNIWIYGEDGNDYIQGGDSRDALSGGEGNDVMFGVGGNDALSGDRGNDTLNGGDGRDHLLGGSDQDCLSGGADADTMYGADGNDYFYAAGDGCIDNVFGGSGFDTVEGDFFYFENPFLRDQCVDVEARIQP
jgi:Ca2+-binding RTX toxin-like protein